MPYNADGEYYSHDDEEDCDHCDCYGDGGRCCDCGVGDDNDEDDDESSAPAVELTTDDDGSEEVKD